MFLARIQGSVTSTVKHETLADAKLLLGRRLEADGSAIGEPIVIIDTLGAGRGAVVLVTTDGDVIRSAHGDTSPARLSVVGIVQAGGGAR